MTSIIYIGFYDKSGNFTNERWVSFIKWCSMNCDNIRIYTELSFKQIERYFFEACEIIEENFSDPSLDIKGYRLWCTDPKTWNAVLNAPFHIDSGIAHIHFLKGDSYKADLEVEDCENFIELDISEDEEQLFVNAIPWISENIKDCMQRKEQIDYLLNNEQWRPLGQ